MSTDSEWIAAAIEKARKQSTPATEAVWARVVELLKGKFSQRGIPSVELANIARELIEEMVPAPSTPERPK